MIFAQLLIYSQIIHSIGGDSCFWGFIDGRLNTTYWPKILDQEKFYLMYKWKYGYKYQGIIDYDSNVSRLMRLFIDQRDD